jgi:biotin carboxyl carrier protein
MSHVVVAELVANVLSIEVEPGQKVGPLDTVVVLESMKMEIPVLADVPEPSPRSSPRPVMSSVRAIHL